MKRFAYIDLLRGIAVLTVIVHHLPESIAGPFGRLAIFGGRGVDLFFVLSGFLIGSTALARAESGAPPLAQAKAYWLLRTVRIWPLYFLLLAVCAVGLPGIDHDVTFVVRHYPARYLTFTSNDLGQATLELGVLWSLAIEEQFYLVVGCLVATCARNRAALTAAFTGTAIAAVAVAMRTRFELLSLHAEHGLDQIWFTFRTYHSTLARIDQLALGLLAAVLSRQFNALEWARSPRLSRTISWGAVALAVAVEIELPQFKAWEFLVVGIVFAGVVLVAQRPGARAAAASPVEHLVLEVIGGAGKLSFGLYLVHPFVRHWTLRLFERGGIDLTPKLAPLFLALWVAQSWVLAALSYKFFEDPLLTRARRAANRWVGLKAAAITGGERAPDATPAAVHPAPL